VEALADYDRVLILNNGLAKAYHNRGNIKVLLNDLASAREDYDMAIALDGNLEKTYFNRGVLRFLMGNPEEGCQDLWESRSLGYDEAVDKTDKYCQ
jgi:tetratricopeptide (TPR) repeat protein